MAAQSFRWSIFLSALKELLKEVGGYVLWDAEGAYLGRDLRML